MRNQTFVSIAFLSAAMLASTAGSAWAISTQTATPTGSWTLAEIDGEEVQAERVPTLDIVDTGDVSGVGGCNRFAGKAEIRDDEMSFGALASTKMACDETAMQLEQVYLKAFETVASWKLEEDQSKLILADTQGQPVLVFGRTTKGAAITIDIPDATEQAQSQSSTYDCNGTQVEVTYINAGSVSLATLTIGNEFVVAANVITGSGARYAGDRFIWHAKGGADATLEDLTKGEDAAPVACVVAG
ncbi:META domain-containing protein [Limoniibacter endophyticus]|uniref:Heat shock protein HslJ n=1 Tax=Limoniibacter endophyticus TaxID=1565040 RepID=A0A8J3DHJ4_9HYPH|nr:META domain-containing protein [Limoniibacter endophyticus]GHC67581.1 hypothetical protein GCM10010136_11750 [Limoniibacter endophyticus]